MYEYGESRPIIAWLGSFWPSPQTRASQAAVDYPEQALLLLLAALRSLQRSPQLLTLPSASFQSPPDWTLGVMQASGPTPMVQQVPELLLQWNCQRFGSVWLLVEAVPQQGAGVPSLAPI